MLSRIFSVETQKDSQFELTGEYKGFDRNINTAEIIAVVNVQGEHEVWALDDGKSAVDELLRYYKDNEYFGYPKILVFKKLRAGNDEQI